jgi:hypothetical protein
MRIELKHQGRHEEADAIVVDPYVVAPGNRIPREIEAAEVVEEVHVGKRRKQSPRPADHPQDDAEDSTPE